MSGDAVKHDYHLVKPSPWPLLGSMGDTNGTGQTLLIGSEDKRENVWQKDGANAPGVRNPCSAVDENKVKSLSPCLAECFQF